MVFSLLFGLVLASFLNPTSAEAGFLSFIFPGDSAYAKTVAPDTQSTNIDSSQNSSTMDLLQANVSPVSIMQKKGDIPSTDITPNIVSENALVPTTGPMGVSDGTDPVDPSSLDTSVYVVRKGDSVSTIAKMFGVSTNTILWANDMKKGDKLNEGDVLFVFSSDVRVHKVSSGQTLKSIAKLYEGVDVNDIITYNDDLTIDSKLVVGDELMIPGGDMSDEGGDQPSPNLGSAVTRDSNYYATHPTKNVSGDFINPVPNGLKTQGLHGPGHRGIDIGAPRGTPIYASASGTVIAVKTGCVEGQRKCGGGYGNMVKIQNTNGTTWTLDGHMSKVATFTGAKVNQGEIIGYVGSTGRSTGPHDHHEVGGAKNPGADWSWAH